MSEHKLLTAEEIETWLKGTFGNPSLKFVFRLAYTALAALKEIKELKSKRTKSN